MPDPPLTYTEGESDESRPNPDVLSPVERLLPLSARMHIRGGTPDSASDSELASRPLRRRSKRDEFLTATGPQAQGRAIEASARALSGNAVSKDLPETVA